jgi:predicted nuclease of predicted toxin-antitoxin system
MKRIVLDQGLPATAAVILREQGWDAVHIRELEMQTEAEIEILDYAAREYSGPDGRFSAISRFRSRATIAGH